MSVQLNICDVSTHPTANMRLSVSASQSQDISGGVAEAAGWQAASS